MGARLYGRGVGNGSLAVVTAGFHEALQQAGLLEGFVAIDRAGGSEEDDAPAGALARDGIFTGNLNLLPLMRQNARHERHWVTVTPNSTHVPPQLLDAVVRLPSPHILSASRWGSDVIFNALCEISERSSSGVLDHFGNGYVMVRGGRVEIVLARHGVSGFSPDASAIAQATDAFCDGKLRFVHFSTTEGQRKGTLELLKAWQFFWPHYQNAELRLVLDHHARAALEARMFEEDLSLLLQSFGQIGVRIMPRGDLNPAAMSQFLGTHHFVVAPSRGEGFSLLPLSARACGVPCISTDSTGNGAGHVRGPGVVVVPSGPLAPIDDGPDALAPTVDPEALAQVMRDSACRWEDLSKDAQVAAADVSAVWSWHEQLKPLIERLP